MAGLPPSPVHAEVVTYAASWAMIHKSGPEGIATAERAVELARLVGARETELRGEAAALAHRLRLFTQEEAV